MRATCNFVLGAVCATAPAFSPICHAQETQAPIEEVTVTGTRIPEATGVSTSPVTTLSSAEIKLMGTTRVEDAINQLPQAFADQSITANNGSVGTATVNLRDLGPERTLVLIDGKRLMPGDPTSGSVAPDLNFIPDALVDHIEVVTGAASAVYGSDAVAGVVNFIMKQNFTGLELDAQAGAYEHGNGERAMHSDLAARGYAQPPSTNLDGFTGEATLVGGMDLPDGNGNISLYGGYRHTDPIANADRDFSACALTAGASDFLCSASFASTFPAHFFVLDPATFELTGNLTLDSNGPGNTVRPFDRSRDGFNYAPYQYFQRNDTRYTAGALAHYALSPAAELYLDPMFMKDETTAQVAPSGLFADVLYAIRCDNPMLSADEVQNFCTDANVPPDGHALIAIGRRNVEGGGRQARFTHSDYRVVAGVRGNVDGWHYDISAQYGAVAVEQGVLNDVSLARTADALDVVRDASGNLVCASGNSGCVPYDVFRIGGVTKAALAYVSAPAKSDGDTNETVVSAAFTGSLPGLKSPWAANAPGLALGAEYRREGLDYSPDAELASGDLSGLGQASPPVTGVFDVAELYSEARLALIQNGGWFLQDLTVEGGYRYSWYSNAGAAPTYKLGAEWVPIGGVTFRTSFNRAVRAPNVVELFTPQLETQGELEEDPCAGANPAAANPLATAPNCARTGVTSAEYGKIVPSPDQSYNTLDGGNPKLRPETAETKTFGVVIESQSIEGLSFAVDYYDIAVRGVIRQIDPSFTLQECLQTGESIFCNLVHRAPRTGSLWLTSEGYVNNLAENAAALETRGMDIDLGYRQPLPAWTGSNLGSIDIRLIGTYVMSLKNTDAAGAQPYDCAGYYGYGRIAGCADPIPRWRHVLRTTWTAPWNFDVSVAWRYISATQVAASSRNPVLANTYLPADFRLASRDYFNISAAWRLHDRLELRVGVNNLFDTDPPVAGTAGSDFLYGVAANGNTYPGVYDALGRWLFVGLTARD